MSSVTLKSLPRCPLCVSAERQKEYDLCETTVYRCSSCKLAYLDPCLDPETMAKAYESSDSLKQFHDFHEGYYEYGSLEKESKTLREFTRSLALAESLTPPVGQNKIFEVGFGNGLFLALANKRGWSVDGIDTSATNATVAKQRFNLELRKGFFEAVSSEIDHWTAVAMMDVIEHADNPYALLSKAHELLIPGGILLLATPNEGSFFRKVSDFFWRFSGGRVRAGIDKIYFLEHVAYYDKKTLAELMRRAGFEPAGYFYSETDLAKYRLKPLERLAGEIILFFSRLLRSENRLIMAGRKIEKREV